jgi:hypothetical protein
MRSNDGGEPGGAFRLYRLTGGVASWHAGEHRQGKPPDTRFDSRTDPQFFDWPSLYLYLVSALQIFHFNAGRLAGRFQFEFDFLAAAARLTIFERKP